MFRQTILCHLHFTIVFIGAVNPAFIPKTNWFADAQKELQRSLRAQRNTNIAKNVILFVGDGMGVSTVSAARILRGQLQGRPGEETVLEFEKFPHVGMSKTYANDLQTPDSASTATAMMCGEKTNGYTVGVNDNVKVGNCSSQPGNELRCITDWFQDEGRSSGVVTTTRVTHATPAAAYAKTPNRNWEGDSLMEGYPLEGCGKDIAHQLVFNSTLKVVMGGGRVFFRDNTTTDPEWDIPDFKRRDGLDLVAEWKKMNKHKRAKYVWNKAQFDKVDPSKTDHLLGLFEASHMNYELDRASDIAGEPSLAEMAEKAIKILRKDPKGFFLLVEGGRIDHGHHQNNAMRALHDVLVFEDAVKKAVQLTNEKETLIIVSADHSHVFTMAGYSLRGNDIFGMSNNPTKNFDMDGVPYTTLSYANGPGHRYGYRNISDVINSTSLDFKQETTVPLRSETHGGEDVAIYARGPMSHLIHGVHEQHYIAHVMAYAACVGPSMCDRSGYK
ncbi:alkaline phosphatase, tissue-nonspecific isozyme-like [Pecten maximus]|uniref:alkaline phosphatase, tissue-nonspecific isozyme-like n=1 Tax=Pecten maximus TaxID=6579 RepID=UPI001459068D|nr:alkaline phosphatase, tissue-nonspecific isozyme-like [Pecten maximus]